MVENLRWVGMSNNDLEKVCNFLSLHKISLAFSLLAKEI
jgi:hypothetical protein